MGLDRLDLIIIAIYLAGITLFGLRFRKQQRSMRDYFLADRNIPWWAISLSMLPPKPARSPSSAFPGSHTTPTCMFLQVVMGYVVGRVIISFVLLPQYFRGDLYTAYELIERRFGGRLRSLTAGLFLHNARRRRRSARLCGFDRGGDCARDRRSRLDRHHHGADADLHV